MTDPYGDADLVALSGIAIAQTCSRARSCVQEGRG